MSLRGLFLDPFLEERITNRLNSKYQNIFEFGDVVLDDFNDIVYLKVDGKETSLWFSITILEHLTDEELDKFCKKVEEKLKTMNILLVPKKGNVYLKIMKHNKNKGC